MQALGTYTTQTITQRRKDITSSMIHEMQARHQDTKGKQVQGTSQFTWRQARIWHQLLQDVCTSCHLVLDPTPIGSFHFQQVVHKTS
jgi:Na+-translocating ferredoxin:NAD+ oxidoreductase RNF subunit RnfB